MKESQSIIVRAFFLGSVLPKATLSGVLLASLLAACSGDKEEQKSASTSPTVQVQTAETLAITNPLLARIPANSFGFFEVDGTLPAYRKANAITASQNGSMMKAYEQMIKGTEAEKVFQALELNPADPTSFDKVVQRTVGYVAPTVTADGKDDLVIGYVFESPAAFNLATKMAAVKTEVQKDNANVVEETLKNGSGFVIKLKKENSPFDGVHIGWKDNIGAVATSAAGVDQLLGAPAGGQPAVISSAKFKEEMGSLPGGDTRFGSGFLDVEALLASKALLAKKDEKFNAAEFPVKSFAFAQSMNNVLEYGVKVALDGKTESQKSWLGALGGSKTDTILNSVPANPFLVLSIDGSTVNRLKDIAILQAPAEQQAMAKTQLALLDGLKRVGLSARVAPLGQSMFPVPDMVLAFETSNAPAMKTQLQQLISMAAQSSGMPMMQWSEKKVGPASVNYMLSPFGVGVFMTATDNGMLLLTSSEPQMKDSLTALSAGTSAFAKSLSGETQTKLQSDESLGTFYMNFSELASLLDNVSSTLDMFGPQASEAKKMLSKEQIEALRKSGTVVTTVKADKTKIELRAVYEPVANEKVAAL